MWRRVGDLEGARTGGRSVPYDQHRRDALVGNSPKSIALPPIKGSISDLSPSPRRSRLLLLKRSRESLRPASRIPTRVAMQTSISEGRQETMRLGRLRQCGFLLGEHPNTMRSGSARPCDLALRERPPAHMGSGHSCDEGASRITTVDPSAAHSNWGTCVSMNLSSPEYPSSYQGVQDLPIESSIATGHASPPLDYRWKPLPDAQNAVTMRMNSAECANSANSEMFRPRSNTPLPSTPRGRQDYEVKRGANKGNSEEIYGRGGGQ